MQIANTTALAQLVQQEDGNRNRYRQALDLLLEAETEAEKLIADVKEVIAQHAQDGDNLRAEMAQRRAVRRHGSADTLSDNPGDDKGKGKAKAQNDTPDPDLEEDEEGVPRNPAGEAHRAKSTSLSQRLREARIALHKIKFLQGDVYHVLGNSHEDAENEAYAAAEDLRRTLLKGTCSTVGYSEFSL